MLNRFLIQELESRLIREGYIASESASFNIRFSNGIITYSVGKVG